MPGRIKQCALNVYVFLPVSYHMFVNSPDEMQHADQKYIDAIINNDPLLLNELYTRFSGKVKGLVLDLGGTDADAKDVLQEALLTIFNRAKAGDFILTCPFEAFLYLVCKRIWIKEVRKRRLRTVTIDAAEASLSSDGLNELADECMIERERQQLILKTLNELGERCKSLLMLSWSGKSMEEVAGELNITYGYARKKKSSCMGRLVELIKQSSKYTSLRW